MPTTVVIGISALAQRVLHHHLPPRQSLGARGADVVLPQHLQHGGARDARQQSRQQQRQRNRRHGGRGEPAQRIIGERDIAAGRQPAQVDREEDDHQQAEIEIRQRNADHGEQHRHLIHPGVLPQRRDDAADQSDQQRDHQRIGRQRQRHRQAQHRGVHHRLAQQQRTAEIAVQQARVPAPELRQQRLIEAEIMADVGDLLRRGGQPGDRRRGIAGDQMDHGKGDQR